MTFDLRPLRQQNGFGISVSEFDHGRRSREENNNNTTSTTENHHHQEQQPQQQDFSILVPEVLQKSIKDNFGNNSSSEQAENLILRFRFDNVANKGIMNNIFSIIKTTLSGCGNNNNNVFNVDKLKTFTLDLERCGITDDILIQLFNYFEYELQKPVLTHLYLAGNLITARGLQTLLHQKDKNPPLTTETGKNLHHLGVTANPLGGRGLDVLSEFLEINPLTNKIKILHATRISWVSQSSIAALKAKIAAQQQQQQQNHNNTNNSSTSPGNGGGSNSRRSPSSTSSSNSTSMILPAPVAAPPGGISVYEAERFANATRNSTSLTTVYFKQNAIQAAVDEEIEWDKKVILGDS